MIIVPVAKDIIKTVYNAEMEVVSYTRFKSAGPAVYCKVSNDESNVLVYFFDIKEINGIEVEYKKPVHVFKSFGKMKRKYHLPQKNDTIFYTKDVLDEEGNKKVYSSTVEKVEIKLSSTGSHYYGLYVLNKNKKLINMSDVVDVKSNIGSSMFDKSGFIRYYEDYMG